MIDWGVVPPDRQTVLFTVPLEKFTQEEIQELVSLGIERELIDRLHDIIDAVEKK